jgi:hypothetical protein
MIGLDLATEAIADFVAVLSTFRAHRPPCCPDIYMILLAESYVNPLAPTRKVWLLNACQVRPSVSG